jgi:hypothetical protein
MHTLEYLHVLVFYSHEFFSLVFSQHQVACATYLHKVIKFT